MISADPKSRPKGTRFLADFFNRKVNRFNLRTENEFIIDLELRLLGVLKALLQTISLSLSTNIIYARFLPPSLARYVRMKDPESLSNVEREVHDSGSVG